METFFHIIVMMISFVVFVLGFVLAAAMEEVKKKNLPVHFHCRQLSFAFIVPSKRYYEQIQTFGWAFMHRLTNVPAHQGLHRVIQPWTVKMSAPISNNARLSMLHFNICTSYCIFRCSSLEVYLCHTVHFFPDCGLQNEAAALGLISPSQSASVRLKATKPQGSRAAAACSA